MHDRPGRVSRRHPRLAGGELPGRNAHADAVRKGRLLGRAALRIPSPAQKQWLDVDGRRAAGPCPTGPRTMAAAGCSAAETKVLQGGNGGDRRAQSPLTSFGISMLGPALLKYGTEEQKKRFLPADRARRDPLVPGLFRAGRGQRPGRPADQGRGQGRPLAGQRPEGVDQLRRRGRLDLLPGADLDRVQAWRDQLPAVRHGKPRASRPSRSC